MGRVQKYVHGVMYAEVVSDHMKDWVPPYLHPVTQIDLRRTMKMPPTEGDGPGYLYTYEIRGM